MPGKTVDRGFMLWQTVGRGFMPRQSPHSELELHMKTYVIAAALVAAAVLPVIAQSSGGDTSTLSALLVEVRALRVAMERAASTTPQIQLLAARLTVQNERLSRVSRDADAAHQELEVVADEGGRLAARVAQIEDAIGRQPSPEMTQQLKNDQMAMKVQLDELSARETRLRAREAELSNAVAAEQAQWTELNRRLDDLERELAGRRPQ
jgi:chromosome segregation ATPase